MSTRGRTVLLTGSGTEHRYVAATLAARGLLDAIVEVHPLPRPLHARVRAYLRRFGYRNAIARVALRLVLLASGETARRAREVRELLSSRPPLPPDLPVHHTAGVNSEQTRELLRSLAPEVLCIYGTAVVADETLALAAGPAINLHTGISPRYRGADCAFWPLVNGEPAWLGATVHRCTSSIDGGEIYATRRARLTGEEGVGGAFARAVETGTEALAEVLGALESFTPVPQDLTTGREYRAAMRGWRAELRALRNLRAGVLRRAAEPTPGR